MLPLEKEGILFDSSMQSPPPNKDYINICITFSSVSICIVLNFLISFILC